MFSQTVLFHRHIPFLHLLSFRGSQHLEFYNSPCAFMLLPSQKHRLCNWSLTAGIWEKNPDAEVMPDPWIHLMASLGFGVICSSSASYWICFFIWCLQEYVFKYLHVLELRKGLVSCTCHGDMIIAQLRCVGWAQVWAQGLTRQVSRLFFPVLQLHVS